MFEERKDSGNCSQVQTITFGEIRPGDTIEEVTTYSDMTIRKQGIVNRINANQQAVTKDGYVIVSKASADPHGSWVSGSVRLLNRPKVNAFAYAGIGSLAKSPQSNFIYYKTDINTWKMINGSSMKTGISDIANTDFELSNSGLNFEVMFDPSKCTAQTGV